MEILPSALCCRMRVPLFIRIKTIRKSGYFARVLELLPVSRCQESSFRNSCSSCSKSISKRGSAKPGSRVNASIPSPGGQLLRFVTMMNTFLLYLLSRPTFSQSSPSRRPHRNHQPHVPKKTGQHCTTFEYGMPATAFIVELSEARPNHTAAVASQPYVQVSLSFQAQKTARSTMRV